MSKADTYHCAFIGGGLAGLTAAIHLAKSGYRILLFEKETYPFHKVCGEYISMESWDYLLSLGVPLQELQLPRIHQLLVSAPSGLTLEQDLPLGGFGISRYLLDDTLMQLAKNIGVKILNPAKVDSVEFDGEQFTINSSAGTYTSTCCCGSYGKRSNLDRKWNRPFILKKPNPLNHFIGVKYHIAGNFSTEQIALHNFSDGYCGLSKIEGDRYCLCYLTTAENLKRCGNSIATMETEILSQNPYLKKIIGERKSFYEQPITISQVSFNRKSQVENHVLMLGDAAGLITPLCGNGMSMAMHSGKLAVELIDHFLQKKISRERMEQLYQKRWKKLFARRLAAGRMIQRLFGKPSTTDVFLKLMNKTPKLTQWLIRQTHGNPF
jgi:flavin-dependent dehydrogenase